MVHSPVVPPRLRVLIDFDGTLVVPNVAIVLVAEFAKNGEALAHEVDEELHAGKITLRQAWEREVAVLPIDRLDEMAEWAVRNTPIRDGARELVDLLESHEVPTAVVSGGLDFYIRPILKHAGFDLPIYSDTLEILPQGTARLAHPYGHETCRLCGICKAQAVRTLARGPERAVFVGDGSTDKFAAEVADIVFARGRLKSYCDRSGIPHYPFDEVFAPVTDQIRRWLDADGAPPAVRHVGLAESVCPISSGLAAQA
jgi:2-hydroxy-3-keto-5-methylthiopentenyl-1-phosphate phosphatase